jgi:TolB-like protein/DNA-binding winged helix-turn-helix (wHTH) protein/Tfp pilus assembly protein PilF
LEESGKAVSISSRALDILNALIEARDRIVSRDELVARAWPGVVVDASNLSVQVSALRKALRDTGDQPGLIATIPGRGYRFIGCVALSLPGSTPHHAAPEAIPAKQAAAGKQDRPKPRIARWRAAALLAPILVAATLAQMAHIWTGRTRAPGVSDLSIMVLPFRDLSDNGTQEHLADAVTNDLTTGLARIPRSSVVARPTAAAYKGRDVAIADLRHTLGVHYVVEGSVRDEAGLLHVNVQLIDATSGTEKWADRFSLGGGNGADLESAIVRRIASRLDMTLVALEAQHADRAQPTTLSATDFYYRGRAQLDKRDDLVGMAATQHLYEQAITIDPAFTDALNDLGWLLLSKSADVGNKDAEADLAEARSVIAKALRAAPRNARVLASQARLQTIDGDCEAALATYKTALEIEPNDLRALAGSATCAWQLGDVATAYAQTAEALRLDPLGASAGWRYHTLGILQFMQARYQDAVASFGQALAGQPDPQPDSDSDSLGLVEWSRLYLIASYERLGNDAMARRKLEEYRLVWPHRSVWRMLSYFTRAQARLPGMRALHDGLKAAGMPEFADPDEAPDVPASHTPHGGGEFDPTPHHFAEGGIVDVAGLAALLRQDVKPILVDVGPGAGIVPGAVWASTGDQNWSSKLDQICANATHDRQAAQRTYVVFSAGPFGWDGYDAALRFAKAGLPHVSWFRGGEEAWVAAGMTFEDKRNP